MRDKKYQLVLVTWKDAQSSSDWEEEDKISKWATEDYLVNDIGWDITPKGNKKYVVICSQIGCDGSLGNKTKIPKQWVVKKVCLKY